MKFEEQVKINKNNQIAKIIEHLIIRKDIREKLDNENKSLDKMFEFILWNAKKLEKNGSAMVDDDVVFGWAVHYYDEDKTELDVENEKKEAEYKKRKETSEKEKKQMKAKVEKQNDEKEPIKLEDIVKPYKPKKVAPETEGQMSLF